LWRFCGCVLLGTGGWCGGMTLLLQDMQRVVGRISVFAVYAQMTDCGSREAKEDWMHGQGPSKTTRSWHCPRDKGKTTMHFFVDKDCSRLCSKSWWTQPFGRSRDRPVDVSGHDKDVDERTMLLSTLRCTEVFHNRSLGSPSIVNRHNDRSSLDHTGCPNARQLRTSLGPGETFPSFGPNATYHQTPTVPTDPPKHATTPNTTATSLPSPPLPTTRSCPPRPPSETSHSPQQTPPPPPSLLAPSHPPEPS